MSCWNRFGPNKQIYCGDSSCASDLTTECRKRDQEPSLLHRLMYVFSSFSIALVETRILENLRYHCEPRRLVRSRILSPRSTASCSKGIKERICTVFLLEQKPDLRVCLMFYYMSFRISMGPGTQPTRNHHYYKNETMFYMYIWKVSLQFSIY